MKNTHYGTTPEIVSQTRFQKFSCPLVWESLTPRRAPRGLRAEKCRAGIPGSRCVKVRSGPAPVPPQNQPRASPQRHLLEGGGADGAVLPDLRAQPVAAGACSLCLRVPGADRARDTELSRAERDRASLSSAEIRHPAPRQHECTRPGPGPPPVAAVPGASEWQPGTRVGCGRRGESGRAAGRAADRVSQPSEGAQVQRIPGKLV